ncbi:hypothetical protein [Pontibacter ruber]|uniref:STAS/SEC14 domain-containing protein n=1 Tax=Pontibacter ruber TaxID=1343895 RepID=A0ABW5D214_9BACT|nr:hypothetical protein [Pontibacter ruber]
MIIFSNGLITLDYEPATDILSVALPDIRNFGTTEVERSLEIIVESITNYDVKKLLLNSSKAIIEVEDVVYRNIIMKFSSDLMKTRLKYLARVGSNMEEQEKRANKVAEEVRYVTNTSITFRNFTDNSEAMEWLLKQ